MAEQCGFNGGSNDVTSMLQVNEVNVGQSSSFTMAMDKTAPFRAEISRSMEAQPML